jgi:ligand-binding sensor domain-containing protein
MGSALWKASSRAGCFIMLFILLTCLQTFSAGLEFAGGAKQKGIPQKFLTRFSIRSWSIAEGLPQSTVRSIIQTKDGFIWFGTEEGLVRYDGAQFAVFEMENTPGIPHNNVTSLLELDDGSLLIGTFEGMTHLKDGQFSTAAQSLQKTRVQTLFKDRRGEIWVGSADNGIFSFADDQSHHYTVNEGLSSNSVTAIAEDFDGNMWIGTNAGVTCLKNNKFSFLKKAQGLPSEDVTSICVARDSSIWVGTAKGLVMVHDKAFKIYGMKDGMSDNSVQCIAEDQKGDLWVGTEFGGIDRLSSGKFTSVGTKDGLSSDFVFSIMNDREGNVWIGTSSDGINRLWEGNFAHMVAQNGIVEENSDAVYQARDGSVWIGTIGGGATHISLNRVEGFNTTNGLPANMIRAIVQDREDAVWLALNSGLVRFKNGTFRTFTAENGLAFDRVRAILAIPDGSLWIGTALGTLSEFKNGKVTPVGNLNLSNTMIRTLYRDRSGSIWIGHTAGMIRWKNNEVTTFNPADGCPTEAVYAFHEDDAGTLWIGTYGGGLYRYKNRVFTRISGSVGLFNDAVFQILEDDDNNLWMSCNKGIYRASKQELNDFADGRKNSISCTSFGISDGMITSECNGNAQPAGAKMADGKLIFPTTKGIVVIDPGRLRTNSIPPPVVIEEAMIDRTSYTSTLLASAPAGKGELEFQYGGLSYTAPEKVKFKYMLIGYDDGWKEAGTRRTALYTNIPPGRYTFKVIACNNDGIWNLNGASFEFVLAPHFYQARWFYVLTSVILLGFMFAIYRARVWQLLQREKILKERVEDSLAKIKVLGGLIPICANCKKIRDDSGYWNLLEAYLSQHSEAKLSHSLCPDCATKLYPDIFPKK